MSGNMSTRSKAKAGAAAKGVLNPKMKGRGHAQHDDMDVDGTEKENSISRGTAKLSKKQNVVAKGKSQREVRKPIDCFCTKGDDGSPMIICAECRIWYHFTCIDMSEPEAEEISIYICPTCTLSSGRRSTMSWEGDQANEECTDDEVVIKRRRNAVLGTTRTGSLPLLPLEESEESSDSEDEYVDEKPERVSEEKVQKQNAVRRSTSVASGTDSVDDIPSMTRRRRLSRVKRPASPSPSVQVNLKRKATLSGASQPSPAPKRKKSSDTNNDDPTRKYCLGKLEEVFRDVFLRYPHVLVHVKDELEDNQMDVGDDGKDKKFDVIEKKSEDLTEDERKALVEEANHFAMDLENCVFEIYSEPDRTGNLHAGGKYKERFRMLQFNLSKPDRIMLHQRITNGKITPKEISLMSSTDLADEETKQSIKQAEQEALEHSILLKTTAPRAKITHKGLQDIENVNGEIPTALEVQRHNEREVEEEERRERERMARLRTTQRQRTTSLSVPPESPSVQQNPTDQPWGAPPPVPPHALSPTEDMSKPLPFAQASLDALGGEPELNLADLINIDDEQEPSRGPVDQLTGSQPELGAIPSSVDVSPPVNQALSPITPSTTGISPFASRPRNASFDLNSLWSAPKDETAHATDTNKKIEPDDDVPIVEPTTDEDNDAMELESTEDNDNEHDFDMFLDEEKTESPTDLIVTPIPAQDVENLPQVWTGKIAMPLDSTVPQETHLIARQIAGKPLSPDSLLWKTLFPSEQLRIEGRVPVDNSIKYLMAMRLNPTKELYGAAFTPASETGIEDFKTFCNFLVSKTRHGLVFPWGIRPKDYHPGRELYMLPLLQNQALPEFIELLDDLKLPKIRTRDYLLGIWVLNKGKLAPLPGITPPPVTGPTPGVTQNLAQPNPIIPLAQTPPQNPLFSMPSASILQGPPNVPTPVPPLPPLQIAPADLAAEVASLTPEQLQEVLRTLAVTTGQSLPVPGQQMPPLGQQPPSLPPYTQARPPFPPHVPPMSHSPPVPSNAQPWMHHSPPPPPPPPPPYAMNYPPPNVPYQQQPHHPVTSPQTHYDRRDNERDFRSNSHFPQGHRNHDDNRHRRGGTNQRHNRGNRGNRGGDQHDREFRRNSDSGWPRRSRNDNQGSGW